MPCDGDLAYDYAANDKRGPEQPQERVKKFLELKSWAPSRNIVFKNGLILSIERISMLFR